MQHQRAELPARITGSAEAESFFTSCFSDCDPTVENLFVAHLDSQARCLHLSRHIGDACSTDFPLRTIVATAASLGTAGLVLAHNHPSGDSRPSLSDFRATKKLCAVAEALDCFVLDHLVFGGGQCSSMRQLGVI
ncbi:hypothetical protein G7077_10985 [Sphingomonas piscis]|uniref:MPN domain-containing protein n=1 Tax=Sphingomonas piscis TaxID=2714943 RepID=A0A6G7YRH5_9SPHN|nr:JAB domain-containing protein [Sphingomonas piscis]QIK79348.1 hypothetical protein G7077_10985 [Sphingomonas piscis]